MGRNLRVVAKALIDAVIANPTLNEVGITHAVAQEVKRAKTGLFQNEVDYRVLFPRFRPPTSNVSGGDRWRADLVGFTRGEFVLTEFKVYDEELRNKNPWGVLHFLWRDVEKLEASVRQNHLALSGVAQFIFVVRNSGHMANIEQIRVMLDHWRQGGRQRHPGIKGANYLSVLEVLRRLVKSHGHVSWNISSGNRANVAFVTGVTPLRVGQPAIRRKAGPMAHQEDR